MVVCQTATRDPITSETFSTAKASTIRRLSLSAAHMLLDGATQTDLALMVSGLVDGFIPECALTWLVSRSLGLLANGFHQRLLPKAA